MVGNKLLLNFPITTKDINDTKIYFWTGFIRFDGQDSKPQAKQDRHGGMCDDNIGFIKI